MAEHFYRRLVLQVAEGAGHGCASGSDHGAQMLVGVVGGYLDLHIGSHHPFALAEHQQQASKAGTTSVQTFEGGSNPSRAPARSTTWCEGKCREPRTFENAYFHEPRLSAD